jgi:hypothetical protein
MLVTDARVPLNAKVNWTILKMVMQMESEILRPQLTTLATELERLHAELSEMSKAIDTLVAEMDPILQDALTLKADTAPLWDDAYTLCGNPQCEGDCRICQDGEEDYEEVTEEKYCRRRR